MKPVLGWMLLLMVCVCGCTEQKNTRHYYALNTQRKIEMPPPIQGQMFLDVRRLAIDSVCASKELVYRRTDIEYDIDYYHELIIAPDQMITDKLRRWLGGSGMFTRVLEPGSLTMPTLSLEGNINALYGDFRDKVDPSAVIEMTLYLIRHGKEDSILVNKTFKTRVTLASPDAAGLVTGYTECLRLIMLQFEQATREALTEGEKQGPGARDLGSGDESAGTEAS